MDYKKAGVDIEAGYKSVELMKEHVRSTMRAEVLGLSLIHIYTSYRFGKKSIWITHWICFESFKAQMRKACK